MINFTDQETELMVPGPAGFIQCKAKAGNPERREQDAPIAIICHPHPLFAGTMDNKVVTTLTRTLRDRGLDHLRFNFRGVGKSEGAHDNMLGESADLDALLNLIGDSRPGSKFLLAGFSFGSGVASMVAKRRDDVEHLIVVGPPISKYEHSYFSSYPCPVSIYQGGADEVVEPEAVLAWAKKIDSIANQYWFDEVGHFFHGQLGALADKVNTELDQW